VQDIMPYMLPSTGISIIRKLMIMLINQQPEEDRRIRVISLLEAVQGYPKTAPMASPSRTT
jgi:hypothetical protein